MPRYESIAILTRIIMVILLLGTVVVLESSAEPIIYQHQVKSIENPAGSNYSAGSEEAKSHRQLQGILLQVKSSINHSWESRKHPDSTLDDPCSDSRYGGTAQYLDTLTSGVFQYMDDSDGLDFPFSATELSIDLYYLNSGMPDDSLRLIIGMNCPNFDQICCTPRLQECFGNVTITRGSSFPTLLNLTIDLSTFDCCYSEGFWLSIEIDTVYHGETPSFLFTSRSEDPNIIPVCEQWLITGGEITNEVNEDLGWVMMSVSGECGDCGAVTPVDCEFSNPGPDLDCSQYSLISCEADPTILSNQSNNSLNSDVASYCCANWDESGPERLYAVEVNDNSSLIVELLNIAGGDVDVFVLDSCSASNCLAAGDSIVQLFGLDAGTYFIVVDGYEGDIATYDLQVTCRTDCPASECAGEIRFGSPAGNLYLDGEWDRSLGLMYYSYYSGSGATQTILSGDPEVCELQPDFTWTSEDNSANRLLAADPRNGGQFWCGTINDYELGSGHLYLVNSSGAVVYHWNAIANLPIMRWSGGAFDPDNNHLWVFIRDSIDAGGSRVYELDVSNAASPLVIQGPHVVPQSSTHISLSTGGADYSDETDVLMLVHQGYPVDFVECLIDLEPEYAGPPPGPGLAEDFWCSPDSNLVQGYGLAAFDEGGEEGEFLMLNYTDEDFYHPLNKYSSLTALRPPDCPVVDNLIVYRAGSNINLRWWPEEFGLFRIYSSTNPANDGNPDEGTDPDFILEYQIYGSGSVFWSDSSPLEDFKTYVVVRVCN